MTTAPGLGLTTSPLLGRATLGEFRLGVELNQLRVFIRRYENGGIEQKYSVRAILLHVLKAGNERVLVLGPPPASYPQARADFFRAHQNLVDLGYAQDLAYQPHPDRWIYETRRWTGPDVIFMRLNQGGICAFRKVSVREIQDAREAVWEAEVPLESPGDQVVLRRGSFVVCDFKMFHADVPEGPPRGGPQIYFTTQGITVDSVIRVVKTNGASSLSMFSFGQKGWVA
ncbi:hypothetical protein B0H16DRAFT_1721071 [Mycena metata]|uniref:Uncharacterized protein n=1 Tax=Mycena metata TaxID=1033252 RepID=A0AAD7J668_9AGAR|nr:hypothetical protein B0H16DRAFT_1721071 [Mycena metata]